MSLYIFDLFGTFAFALSGALLGVKKEMDVYGYLVLAYVTAVGGGTVRDILLTTKPFILNDVNYTLVIALAVLLVACSRKYIERAGKWLITADAVGLGVFTVVGATKAMAVGLDFHAVLVLAVLTGTGGGMIRDVLATQVPAVLTREIYASACIAGAVLFWLITKAELPATFCALLTACTVTFIRIYTYAKNYHLPKPG